MSVKERLLRYVRVDTQSDPESETHPSTEKQFDLANLLVEELKEIGLTDAAVDQNCYIYAHLPANTEEKLPRIGFIAHMDTSPDFSGKDVSPRIIENYDGGDIKLNQERTTLVADFPWMKDLAGKTLMVTDGTTLLGADDKAGIACIMDALEYYYNHPEEKHGEIAVAFTPDEEIGRGTDCFDIEKFGADFAYTMDGDSVSFYSDETFNADSAVVSVRGFAIHPGNSKNRMKNAALIAAQYASRLPEALTPAHTEGREGFIHLQEIRGSVEEAELSYILRDFSREALAKYHTLMERLCDYMNAEYGEDCLRVTFRESYRNMGEVLSGQPEPSLLAVKALTKLGYLPEKLPIRGGTDGAALSFRGLPCPNLGTGGNNFHGPYEYCVMEELEDAAVLIRTILACALEDCL